MAVGLKELRIMAVGVAQPELTHPTTPPHTPPTLDRAATPFLFLLRNRCKPPPNCDVAGTILFSFSIPYQDLVLRREPPRGVHQRQTAPRGGAVNKS